MNSHNIGGSAHSQIDDAAASNTSFAGSELTHANRRRGPSMSQQHSPRAVWGARDRSSSVQSTGSFASSKADEMEAATLLGGNDSSLLGSTRRQNTSSGRHPQASPNSARSHAATSSTINANFILTTAVLFFLCVVVSMMTDTASKKILIATSLPVTLTVVQFAMTSLCGFLLLYVFRLHPAQPITLLRLQKVLPIGAFQALGFLFTNISFGLVAVSFSHTVKASESLFTALVAWTFLSDTERYPYTVYLTLLPIVLGVASSSLSEMSFNTIGFLAAIASNLAMACRSVISSKQMKEKVLDDVNLHWLVGTVSFVLLLPILSLSGELQQLTGTSAYLLSSSPSTPSNTVPNGGMAKSIALLLPLCGAGHYTYNLFSFMILARTSPLTHVVMQAVRRVLVIIFSIIYWHHAVSVINVLGIFLVFGGVVAYSRAKSAASLVMKQAQARKREVKSDTAPPIHHGFTSETKHREEKSGL